PFFCSFAQNNSRWTGYFSYNEIIDVAQTDSRVTAASTNALFTRNLITGDVSTSNTIDGLPSETITAVYKSASQNKTLIGYQSGLIVVVNDSDRSITTIVDIVNKQLPPNIKRINHFEETEIGVLISCDFGIAQFNLQTLLFGDTYFIGTTNPEIAVKQTTTFNGEIYAATVEGIKKALITNPNLIDAQQWLTVQSGNFDAVVAFESLLYIGLANGQVLRSSNGTSFQNFTQLSPNLIDLRSANGNLIAVSETTTRIFNENGTLVRELSAAEVNSNNIRFTCATVVNNTVFIGTNTQGLLAGTLNAASFPSISPSGPLQNNVFALATLSTGFWAVYGSYGENLDPNPLKFFGVSRYNNDTGWLNIPNSELNVPSIVRVTVNPSNENEVFMSSYYNGLLRFENDELVEIFNRTNTGTTGLETIFPTDPPTENIRVEQAAFDSQGNLWLTNAIVRSPLKVKRANGSWQSFNMEAILTEWTDTRFMRLAIDRNNTKWMCTRSDGLVGFNETANPQFRRISEGEGNGNLPANRVQTVAVDKRNQLWIGTREGLRVIGADRFLDPDSDLRSNPIIIEEEGLAQELLNDQWITDIVVDGANNKWIGTLDAGVFQVSADGQQTLQRFTTDNSPLPSNEINDIDINSVTGEVFFATTGGLVSYRGNAIDASDDLRDVFVYPNPVRPNYTGTVKVSGLTDSANVKITDITGSLVFEAISTGGTIEWDTTAFGKYRVASGVYMIFISTEDGAETTVKKVMIVR
ncbi:T9SS type A sorting domain-containing protein, partial [Flavobacterium sp.]|uniref:type IX secretion system anionic LPS delivery protein PorZ n=1 Tax=Flavobacterium sp. TaxID=239 RepID=UPI003B99FB17